MTKSDYYAAGGRGLKSAREVLEPLGVRITKDGSLAGDRIDEARAAIAAELERMANFHDKRSNEHRPRLQRALAELS